MDRFTPSQRSSIMRKVKAKNTKPEIIVRNMVYSMGFRYRLNRRNLPGSPDLVFTGRKKAIFVHGCFWHQHQGCRHSTLPSARQEYWSTKLTANRVRDERTSALLMEMGWQVLIVWECELKDQDRVKGFLSDFLNASLPQKCAQVR